MRQIKFRGKRLDNKEWAYGYYVEDGFIHICSHNEDGFLQYNIVDPSTVGQFTGLLDEDGDAIYEGDIIEGCFKYEGLGAHGGVMPDQDCIVHGVVVWVDCGLMLKLIDCEYPLRSDFKEGVLEYMPFSAFEVPECLKITGNQHDNPELLKPNSNAATL